MTPDAIRGQARRLAWHGVLLFTLGLATGVPIGAFTNPRMGLSAHLTGVQNGMALMLFGILWPELRLAARTRAIAFGLLLASLYGLWADLTLAAILGTSRATPIAGAGHHGSAAAELGVTAVLYATSIAVLVAVPLVLRGLGGTALPPSAEGARS